MEKRIKVLENKLDKLPEFSEWYIKNCGGGYHE